MLVCFSLLFMAFMVASDLMTLVTLHDLYFPSVSPIHKYLPKDVCFSVFNMLIKSVHMLQACKGICVTMIHIYHNIDVIIISIYGASDGAFPVLYLINDEWVSREK